ncbi:DUF4124 domain-containing protein [Thermomonas hydrothermalis]|uniref:DUF4124 domain-containing protein n=1 Tax=Thermomonas hydrothermalis TaxID=213588 RepID=A0A1M4VP60_9GAMM|nr:DUF4124 domain-containing protein [Thermomonas hydrothermalis]MCL6619982.1 DUF4124 domain-containing protein [Thermomonas hydrothermalis]SHE70891.1 protein of unknown function [Thermomonas hydrothermalis]
MRQLALLVLALATAAAAWWWFTTEMPRREREREAAAEAAAIQAARANSLYRWRDEDGHLHVSDSPPKGRRYERISKTPREGIEVDGRRQ